MNCRFWGHQVLTLLICFCCAGWSAAVRAGEAGTELARRVYDRPGRNDVAMRATMILKEPGSEPRTREMYVYSRRHPNGDFRSLIRFTAPGDIAGVGLLSIYLANGQRNQWLYLPALGRSRRIPTNQLGGRFVGSDLYYEDLQDRKVADDRDTILRDQSLGGVATKVLESVPVDSSNSVYDKRISWIDEKILLPLRVDFYVKGRPKPIKRFTVHRVQKIQGYWTVMDSTMTDLLSGHSTRIVVNAVKYDQGLPDDLFTVRALEDPSLERRYRP